MSIHALSWVFKHSEAKLGARLVLLVLADHAKDDGTCSWPAVETIAHEARMARRGVQEALRRLEADGAVVPRGKSKAGTVIYDVILGGADSARGAADDAGGAQITASRGAADAPEPSGTVIENRPKTVREEPSGFAEWLGHHVNLAARFELEQSVPRAGTTRRARLAAIFSRLASEGHELEEFKLASLGVLADSFMRSGGHVAPENVLRVEKFGKRVDDGRRATPPGEGKYDRWED